MNSKVSVIKCKDYDPVLVWESTKRAVDLIGGIEAFIKPGSSVLVKPNLLMAKEPEYGIDTHPEVMRAVIRILKEINCQIYIGDAPSVWDQDAYELEEVYVKSGVKRVALEEGVQLVYFDKKVWKGKFPFTTWLERCEYLVSIPKFKTHNLTILTGAIKNLFGLIPGLYKTELHKKHLVVKDFAAMLVDIYMQNRPALTVVDGIVAMEGEGPGTSGKLRHPGLIIAGDDAVAVDSILAIIMGINPTDVLTTKEAADRGLGKADINSIQVLGEKIDDITQEPFELPATSITQKLPRPLLEIVKRLLRFYPKIDGSKCTICGTCVKICPNHAIAIKSKKTMINYSRCISCFCCEETCPASAIHVKRSVFVQMLELYARLKRCVRAPTSESKYGD